MEDVREEDFTKKLSSVYKAITQVSQSSLLQNRDMIGFVGAPWTILVYMLNKSSPKNGLSGNFFNDHSLIKILLENNTFPHLCWKNIKVFDTGIGNG